MSASRAQPSRNEGAAFRNTAGGLRAARLLPVPRPSRDPREVPSALIDKPAPAFTLPVLGESGKQFSPAELRGKVWLLNVWGSWCISCQVEHPALLSLAKMNVAPLIGFDWKDKPDAATKWLAQQGGDPYTLSVTDLDGRVAIDYGVYGAPETFVIDRQA